ncbi:MAG TPA: efflux RND transporter periplasmic adaptor subunit, partial [Bryobacteraceae bacterium]
GRGGRGRGDFGGPVPVIVATVSQKNVPVNIDVIGNVEAYSTISVKAQVGGQLTKTYFQEGDYVKKDDPLFTIDPRPFQAQLSQAEAQLSQAQANLARDTAALGQAQANLARDTANQKYAETESGRYAKLFEQGIVSREQSDQTRASADALSQTILADKAAIESARAQIVASKAAVENATAMVENARLQLGYTSIRSPIDGRTGNLTVKQGNLVAANTMELMTIAEVHPIYVTFSVPEAQLGDIKKYMAQGKLPVTARSQDDSASSQTGVLTFIDNTVDATTGTIKLKGTFQNEDNKLWPGEFVRVTLRLTTRPNAVVVPNQAVQTGQDGQFVYVVKQDRTVEMRPVTTSTRVDQDLVVDNGLEPGETIVTEGQLRLAPGAHVQFGGGGRGGRGEGGGGRGPGRTT